MVWFKAIIMRNDNQRPGQRRLYLHMEVLPGKDPGNPPISRDLIIHEGGIVEAMSDHQQEEHCHASMD